jgi:nucleotide-binding universal stress UspA family protein
MRSCVNRLADKEEARRATSLSAPTELIATDGTPSSRAAVKKGLAIARELGARVTFVSAYRPPWAALGEPSYQRSLTRKLGKSRKALREAKVAAEAFGTEATMPCL